MRKKLNIVWGKDMPKMLGRDYTNPEDMKVVINKGVSAKDQADYVNAMKMIDQLNKVGYNKSRVNTFTKKNNLCKWHMRKNVFCGNSIGTDFPNETLCWKHRDRKLIPEVGRKYLKGRIRGIKRLDEWSPFVFLIESLAKKVFTNDHVGMTLDCKTMKWFKPTGWMGHKNTFDRDYLCDFVKDTPNKPRYINLTCKHCKDRRKQAVVHRPMTGVTYFMCKTCFMKNKLPKDL